VRILFIHNYLTSFVRSDLDLLRQEFDVSESAVAGRWMNPIRIYREVRENDLVFGWFASWHTYLPILLANRLGKPSILVTGGYDLAKLPEARYGNQRGGMKRRVTNSTLQSASALVVNSAFSAEEVAAHAGMPADRIHIIHHGVPDLFGQLPEKSARPVVLSVGNVERDNLIRKGHLPFARTASQLPDIAFILVGKERDGTAAQLRKTAPANLTLTGWVSQKQLLDHYRKAWVYLQPSLHEAFGLSLAEAMLAGCIPVVSPHGALPEVVGDTGIITGSTEPEELAFGVQRALEFTQADRLRTRQRVLECFPVEKRKEALINLCHELAGERGV